VYTKDAIRFSLNLAHEVTLRCLEQIQDAPFTFPTTRGGCHPLWVVGHLALIEGLTHQLIAGGENPNAYWAALFAPETQASADPEHYPTFADVRARYVQLRQKNLQLLDSLSEADLDTPVKNPPEGLEEHFATYGKSFLTLALHQMMHRGQITDAIRSAGRAVRLAREVAA
jgi:DinB superfamily